MPTPSERISQLKSDIQAAFARAEAAGDDRAMDALEALFEDAQRAEDRVRLGELFDAATALTALADRLDAARREIGRAVDSVFLEESRATETGLRDEAGVIARAIRHQPAPEPVAGAAAARADPAITPVAPARPEPQAGAAAASEAPDTPPATPPTTPEAYAEAFERMSIRPDWERRAETAVALILRPDGTARYRAVERMTGVPWWVTGILHALEASLDFRTHLHNGDPLAAPTVNHPPNRPVSWRPGMSWEESAADALTNGPHKLHLVREWSLGNTLSLLERWNGLGYRFRSVMSPYLWSGSDLYEAGKFVADGIYDPAKVSQQVGAAVLIKEMAAGGQISISRVRRDVSPAAPAILGDRRLDGIDLTPFPHAEAELDFPVATNSAIRRGADGLKVRRIQEWCCLHDCATAIDGDFGPATEARVKLFQSRANLAPTGEVDRDTWLLLTRPMRAALAPLELGGTINEAYLRVARQHVAARPEEVGGNNRGPWVRLYMEGRDGVEQRWCAGFVCMLMAQCARDLDGLDAMPFPRQVGVDALVKDARDSGRFLGEDALPAGALRASRIPPGTLFVMRKSARDWNHVGIVRRAERDILRTIEGNTNGENVDGGVARESTRGYTKRDFLVLV